MYQHSECFLLEPISLMILYGAVRSALIPSTLGQLAITNLKLAILITQPQSEPGCENQDFNAGWLCTLKDLQVCDPVLPGDVQDWLVAVHVHLLQASHVGCQGQAHTQQAGETEFCGFPHVFLVHMSTHTSNSLAGFMYCGIDFLVEGPITRWNIPTVLEVLVSW